MERAAATLACADARPRSRPPTWPLLRLRAWMPGSPGLPAAAGERMLRAPQGCAYLHRTLGWSAPGRLASRVRMHHCIMAHGALPLYACRKPYCHNTAPDLPVMQELATPFRLEGTEGHAVARAGLIDEGGRWSAVIVLAAGQVTQLSLICRLQSACAWWGLHCV